MAHSDPTAAVDARGDRGEVADDDDNALDQPSSVWQGLGHFYTRNLGLFLVFLAEVFASLVRGQTPGIVS